MGRAFVQALLACLAALMTVALAARHNKKDVTDAETTATANAKAFQYQALSVPSPSGKPGGRLTFPIPMPPPLPQNSHQPSRMMPRPRPTKNVNQASRPNLVSMAAEATSEDAETVADIHPVGAMDAQDQGMRAVAEVDVAYADMATDSEIDKGAENTAANPADAEQDAELGEARLSFPPLPLPGSYTQPSQWRPPRPPKAQKPSNQPLGPRLPLTPVSRPTPEPGMSNQELTDFWKREKEFWERMLSRDNPQLAEETRAEEVTEEQDKEIEDATLSHLRMIQMKHTERVMNRLSTIQASLARNKESYSDSIFQLGALQDLGRKAQDETHPTSWENLDMELESMLAAVHVESQMNTVRDTLQSLQKIREECLEARAFFHGKEVELATAQEQRLRREHALVTFAHRIEGYMPSSDDILDPENLPFVKSTEAFDGLAYQKLSLDYQNLGKLPPDESELARAGQFMISEVESARTRCDVLAKETISSSRLIQATEMKLKAAVNEAEVQLACFETLAVSNTGTVIRC